MVWAARESIGGTEVFPRDMGKAKIKFGEVEKPASLASVEFLGLAEVGEVLMVGEDLDRRGGSEEIMSPRV